MHWLAQRVHWDCIQHLIQYSTPAASSTCQIEVTSWTDQTQKKTSMWQQKNWNKTSLSFKLTFTTFGRPTKSHGPSLQTDPTSLPRLITLAHWPVWQSQSRIVPSLLPEQSLLHLRGSAIPLTACYQKTHKYGFSKTTCSI